MKSGPTLMQAMNSLSVPIPLGSQPAARATMRVLPAACARSQALNQEEQKACQLLGMTESEFMRARNQEQAAPAPSLTEAQLDGDAQAIAARLLGLSPQTLAQYASENAAQE